MTTGKHAMGEQPIFTCKAHVFHIDPKTKRSWIPASASAVNVSFFYDSTRSLYRIISVEGTKAVINSTITPNMTFTKTSQKFGQWSDVRANTVYGLGFSSEAELNKFIEKFQDVKEATRQAAAKATTNGTTQATPITSANASPITSRAGRGNAPGNASPNPGAPIENLQDLVEPPASMGPGAVGVPSGPIPAPNMSALSLHDSPASNTLLKSSLRNTASNTPQPGESPKHTPKMAGDVKNSPAAANFPPGSVEAQLKYENDRLKLALAQSSANAKKWEVELSTLKNNNVRLTSALQESTANVDEWKRQLHSYKEDNHNLKTKYIELEAAKGKGSQEAAQELRKELQSLRTRVEALDLELQGKNEEVRRLKGPEPQQGRPPDERVKAIQEENQQLNAALQASQAQLETSLMAQESQRRVLDTLNAQLAARVQELAAIHREINTALNT